MQVERLQQQHPDGKLMSCSLALYRNSVLITSEMERIFRAISENEGISIIPYDSLKDTLKEHEDLTYAFIADPGNYRLLKLCWPKKNFESRRNQMFREYALNYFAESGKAPDGREAMCIPQ